MNEKFEEYVYVYVHTNIEINKKVRADFHAVLRLKILRKIFQNQN